MEGGEGSAEEVEEGPVGGQEGAGVHVALDVEGARACVCGRWGEDGHRALEVGSLGLVSLGWRRKVSRGARLRLFKWDDRLCSNWSSNRGKLCFNVDVVRGAKQVSRWGWSHTSVQKLTSNYQSCKITELLGIQSPYVDRCADDRPSFQCP